jgi:DNA-binding response OmpR family regulator
MGMRVLLVEDSAELLNYMGELVASAGYDVLRANDGDKAMEVLRENRCDLMVLDLFMPNKDGIETLRELSKLSPRPRTLAISGGGRFSAPDTLRVAARLGADSTLAKPFTPRQLLDALKDLASPQEQKTQTASPAR